MLLVGFADQRFHPVAAAAAALSMSFRYLKGSEFGRLTAHRLLRSTTRLALIGSSIFLTAGCATIAPRNVLPQASAAQIELDGFHNIRCWGDAPARDIQAIMMEDAPRAEMRSRSGAEKHPLVSNLLAISGGAEDGAFGAGLLVGWSDAGTRPVFDLVTGVSSGALIAPFAVLGR